MKISELIIELQKFKDKNGDLPVYVPDTYGSGESNTRQGSLELLTEKYTNHDPINGKLIYPKRLVIT